MTVGKETAVIALPGVVEHLLAQAVVDMILVGILVLSLDGHASFIQTEAIVRPEGVVKRERSFLSCALINKHSLRAILAVKVKDEF